MEQFFDVERFGLLRNDGWYSGKRRQISLFSCLGVVPFAGVANIDDKLYIYWASAYPRLGLRAAHRKS